MNASLTATCPACHADLYYEDPYGRITPFSTQPCENCAATVCRTCAGDVVCADCRAELCGRCALLMEDGDRYCELCALAVIDIESEEWAEIRLRAAGSAELLELEMLARHGIEHEIERTREVRVRRDRLNRAIAKMGQAHSPVEAVLAASELGYALVGAAPPKSAAIAGRAA
jgi:hypothetical protein